MRFAPPRPPRRMRENIVPMINVVFLLLIFFLMTAQIAPPDPFDITPPDSVAQEPAQAGQRLYLSAEGTPAFGDALGEDALAALADWPQGEVLEIRADAALAAGTLAALLPRLAALGVTETALVTTAVAP